MNSLYVLIISLWGFTGAEWVYVGNQIVYQEPMTKQECEVMADNWSKYELNEFWMGIFTLTTICWLFNVTWWGSLFMIVPLFIAVTRP